MASTCSGLGLQPSFQRCSRPSMNSMKQLMQTFQSYQVLVDFPFIIPRQWGHHMGTRYSLRSAISTSLDNPET